MTNRKKRCLVKAYKNSVIWKIVSRMLSLITIGLLGVATIFIILVILLLRSKKKK